MTLGKLIDHRTDATNPNCDAILRPSVLDETDGSANDMQSGQQPVEAHPAFFHFLHSTDTTVDRAISEAETLFSFAVTVELFDRGVLPRPLDDPDIRKALARRKGDFDKR